MNVTFLNPWLLFGLAAVSLPILIHRIVHKRPVVRKFAAVHLLLQSRQITARPQRLKHLLLLALRILAVALIAFMMARPIFVHSGGVAIIEEGAKVLILDNSLSMAYREDRGPRFEVAKSAAHQALKGFDGRVMLIPTVAAQQGPPSQWLKPQAALKAMDAIPLSFGRGNPTAAFVSAYQQLKDLNMPKQILVLSDMARSDWEGFDLTGSGIVPQTEVTFLRIGGAGRDPNFRIKDVRLAEDVMVAGVPDRLEVVVSNLTDDAAARLVQIELADRKVDQKSIDLKSGQDGKVFFDLLVEKPGWVDGVVKLSADRLALDDEFYFSVKVMETVHVLVVDGDPKTSLKAGESYFLASALHPDALERSPFMTSVITAGEMARVNLQPYAAIFLLNVARPDFSRLASFLELGRPVFIFLGDQVDVEAYNRFTLAPWQIGERIDAGERGAGIKSIASGRVRLNFLAGLLDSLRRAAVRRYFRLEGTAENLLTLENQDPLLVEAAVGKSRLFLCATSADLAWNDLPLTAAYLPLLQGLLKDAVGWTTTSLAAGFRSAEPFSNQSAAIQTKGPRGGPGIFQFRLPAGEVRQAVNTPAEESDLAKIAAEELKKKFGALDVKLVEYTEDGLKHQRSGRRELWPALLGFLLTVLAVETLLANGIPRFGKQSGPG